MSATVTALTTTPVKGLRVLPASELVGEDLRLVEGVGRTASTAAAPPTSA